MDRQTAIRLIEDTFNHSFDENQFRYFAINLLNEMNEAKAFPYMQGQYIKDSFKSHIRKYRRLGTYKDPSGEKIDVLIVHLKNPWALERSRTMLRNFAASYLKKRGNKDAALIAYHTDDMEDWRFSFVRMEYRQEVTETGKVKVREEMTPARRYSFLVGENEPNHTAQQQIIPILQDDVKNPTISDIEKTFSVDAVTKQFYSDYRRLFEMLTKELNSIVEKDAKIKAEFETKTIDTANFAKKLLGQIVFLYFLQKKGWLGIKKDEMGNFKPWGTGPRDFLRKLFDRKYTKYKNFFNDVLEPLFYSALNNGDRPNDYYDRLDRKIPFLDGGLFEPMNDYSWWETDIRIDNDIFREILDTFDRYNFTVREDEPLEKEVAVDPEMLGKVFENLLEVKDRKSKGTYYTPREIVHYMCQESLINYLATELKDELKREDIETLIKYGETAVEHEAEVVSRDKETKTYSYKLPKSIRDNAKAIDEKLTNIRVCDPAVGSGAFLVGMMNEIIRARNALTPFFKDKKDRTVYNFKRHAIQNCLYGVDIDPGAVEIAKLRLWLSLVVDEADIKQIKPLPNLDYKIVCGNSLLGVEKNLFNANLFSKLEELKPLFFNETNTAKKQEFKKQIDELINQITNGRKDFDFEIYFSEVFHEKKGFDVVIANPPWVVIRHKEVSKNLMMYLKNRYASASGFKVNLFPMFAELSLDLIKKDGITTLIIPNRLLDTPSYRGVREKFINKYKVLDIENLPAGGFDKVVAGNIVLIIQKSINNQKKIFVRNFYTDDILEIPIKDILADQNLTININLNPVAFSIITKMQKRKNLKLKDICSIHVGMMIRDKNNLLVDEPIYKDKIVTGKCLAKYNISSNKYFNLDKIEIFGGTKNKMKHLEKPKLFVRKTGNHIVCALDDEGIFAEQSVYLVLLRDKEFNAKFITALLNSKLITFYFQNKLITNPESYPYLQHYDLENIPILDFTQQRQNPLILLVDKILAITKDEDYLTNSTKQAKVADYEKQIDQLVYKLYGLTKEEITY